MFRFRWWKYCCLCVIRDQLRNNEIVLNLWTILVVLRKMSKSIPLEMGSKTNNRWSQSSLSTTSPTNCVAYTFCRTISPWMSENSKIMITHWISYFSTCQISTVHSFGSETPIAAQNNNLCRNLPTPLLTLLLNKKMASPFGNPSSAYGITRPFLRPSDMEYRPASLSPTAGYRRTIWRYYIFP